MTWNYPLDKFKLGTAFGVKDALHPNGHRGTDYNGFKAGAKLKAVSDGKIVLNSYSAILGNVVVLKVGLNFFGYCHLQEPSPLKPGTKVLAGDVIGKAGTTGSASSGVHLHLTLGLTKTAVFSGKVFDAHKFLTKKIGK
jgi:murein DD-endopeptidase MepM/ murein hydrolase activator NlpD